MNNGRDMSKAGMANLEVLKEDIQNIWNPQRFGILRAPHVVGRVQDAARFGSKKRSVLDMPIKIPGSDVRLPKDLQGVGLEEVIDQCVAFEKTINAGYDAYYLYLTVHQSDVKASTTQRRAGAHIDGMQGERYPEKFEVCHSYLVSDAIPTRFFVQEFPTDLCELTQNWFYEFDRVKNPNCAVMSKNLEINLMTAYNVHESTEATEDVRRTFIRLEFSKKQFNRLGNTPNERFDLDWTFEERGIPKHLQVETFS